MGTRFTAIIGLILVWGLLVPRDAHSQQPNLQDLLGTSNVKQGLLEARVDIGQKLADLEADLDDIIRQAKNLCQPRDDAKISELEGRLQEVAEAEAPIQARYNEVAHAIDQLEGQRQYAASWSRLLSQFGEYKAKFKAAQDALTNANTRSCPGSSPPVTTPPPVNCALTPPPLRTWPVEIPTRFCSWAEYNAWIKNFYQPNVAAAAAQANAWLNYLSQLHANWLAAVNAGNAVLAACYKDEEEKAHQSQLTAVTLRNDWELARTEAMRRITNCPQPSGAVPPPPSPVTTPQPPAVTPPPPPPAGTTPQPPPSEKCRTPKTDNRLKELEDRIGRYEHYIDQTLDQVIDLESQDRAAEEKKDAARREYGTQGVTYQNAYQAWKQVDVPYQAAVEKLKGLRATLAKLRAEYERLRGLPPCPETPALPAVPLQNLVPIPGLHGDHHVHRDTDRDDQRPRTQQEPSKPATTDRPASKDE